MQFGDKYGVCMHNKRINAKLVMHMLYIVMTCLSTGSMSV